MVKFNKQKTRNQVLLATIQNPGTIYFPTDANTIFVNNKEYGKSVTPVLYNRKGVVATTSDLPSNPSLYDVYTVTSEGADYMYAPLYTITASSHNMGTMGLNQPRMFEGISGAYFGIITGEGDYPNYVKWCESDGSLKKDLQGRIQYLDSTDGQVIAGTTVDPTGSIANAVLKGTISGDGWVEWTGANLDGYATTEAVSDALETKADLEDGRVPLAQLPIIVFTQAEYDALTTKDPNIFYFIKEDES